MSQEKLAIVFDINTFKLFLIQRYITDLECVSNSCKRTSGSSSLWWRLNISFVNIVLEILRICPPNIT